MGAVDDLINKLKNVDMSAVINQAIRRNEALIINLNTKSQLSNRGINSDGTPIEPPYAERTKILKRAKGQKTSFVTLRDTGEFHGNFAIKYEKDQIRFISGEQTFHNGENVTQYLEKRYGREFYGLTEENIERLRKLILPSIIQQLRQNG